ncbi:unnamed protein product [Adineta steineri]|uniref:GAR domain-containing protein n=1 Tax=Adineta steineri TaxID=433720 RepID=A0A814QZY0_9BILA|nr:unnamed protein product [Adineta steineri]
MKLKQKLHDQIFHELQLINKQINESTINTNFSVLIQCLEYIEERIHDEFPSSNNELKKHLIDIKQRTLTKSEELLDLKNSIEFFHKSLQKFTEQLSENERYLNTQKPIQRRFGLYPTLLKQMNEYKTFQNQLETSKEQFNDLNKLAIRLKIDSNSIKNSLTSIQIRWQKILTRTNERRKELEKVFQETKKIVRPVVADIDRIKSEVHRQTSLCQCSNKYDVQQIAEGRYRFGGSQSLRLVRILRSTVMVRVGGGWTALDEFLVRHDPCRAKGRTNYELNSQNYPLRDGVAQTMTLFKQRFVNIRRPTYLFPQQQQSTGSLLKKSPSVTPIRPIKDKCRRTSSTYSLKQQQQQSTSLSNGDLSMSADDLSVSPRVSSDSETKQSLIPIAITMYTPATSTLSRTSSRDSILSENSFVSTSSSLKHRPNSCPLEYRIIDPNHSFCSQPFSNVIDQRVTLSEREYIVNKHNYERRRTHGTNLEKMYWNDELAEIALRHARTCVFEHDKMNQRSIPRIPISTGQNLAIGYENWTEVIEGWIEEKEYYCHAFPSTNLFSRYAQMIWHSSVLIGCGAAICPPFGSYNISWNFYVCNYITGLLNSNYHAAYRQGIKDHPLHDCHGKFGGSQSLRLVRILRSTVMVRVGGGWTALDEFLVRHDPCRAKGRTNYELNSQNYPLRDGVAQTMTLFKQRFVNIRRPTYLFPQQQQSTGSLLKKSPSVTPIRPIKDKCRRTSSTYSLKQQQQQSTSLSNGDLSMSADDLSVSPRVSSDSETKQSLIPIAITMYTPATSTLSRTSSRDSILSENSFVSTSSSLKHRPSKLPLPINRHRKLLNSNYHAAYRQGIKDHPLHDCHGKVCLYNGTLNLNTCECQCSSYASGSYCEKLNCSKLPQCPYHSSISCVAVDVPLECPRLCGLCDRYEILKYVYGEDNLIPNVLMSTTTTTTTTEQTSIKMETLFEDLQTSNEISSTLIPNTTAIMLSTSSKINVSYEIFFYLCIKYFISCI